ncbi:MAG TPA: hypothetical protein PLD10_01360 [Rhodopila sp.]|nr:hypothetical protein [Rhodopila sp.]
MLDLTGIMFSSLMMLFIVVRAIRLDRAEPWFRPIKRAESSKAKSNGRFTA